MSGHKNKTVADYIAEIRKLTGGASYVYRGHADAKWLLESAAARRIKKALSDNENEKEQSPDIFVPETSLIDSQTDLLEEARKLGYGKQDGRDLSDLELLTELQHYGAATILIDFTQNPLVALYFACSGNEDQDGCIVFFPDNGVPPENNRTSIKEIIEGRELSQHKPIMHGTAERRIIVQASIFLLNLKEKDGRIKKITVRRKDKKKLLRELEETYQISKDKLFIDFSGFAANRSVDAPYNVASIHFYRGNSFYEKGEWSKAIEAYNESIRLNPNSASAFNNRGIAKRKQRNLDGAIADYDEAIRLDPNDADVLANRGNAKDEKGDLDGAIADYDEAIRLDPNDASILNGRGVIKVRNGDLDGAIADFQRANELKPDNENYKKNLDEALKKKKDD